MQSQIESSPFIIGGAPRSGTTFLCEMLKLSPEICLPVNLRPEPKFFITLKFYEQGAQYYESTWFNHYDKNQHKVWGEKSTNYLEHPSAAKNIKSIYPNAKLIFILRDPIERAISNYHWSVQNGLESESLEYAFHNEGQRVAETPEELRIANPYAYFIRGEYHSLLSKFYEHFPKEQIHLACYERLILDPQSISDQVCSFLNVDSIKIDKNIIENINKNESVKSQIDLSNSLKKLLIEKYKSQISLLEEYNFTPIHWFEL